MFLSRTVRAIMKGTRLWATLMVAHSLLLETSCANHHRRSMPSPTTLPLSKGGWRPVLSSGLPGYGAFAAAPLHAPAYKLPVHVDNYPSSSRPLVARDAAKLTSIAQSYRPTTLRSLPATASPQNQPVNSYLNPFGQQNGQSHFKLVQNFPGENVVIRNPHNPYAARPVFAKYPTKQQFKQQYHNAVYNNQPYQFSYPNNKPQDFGKPVEMYVRPTDAAKRPQSNSGIETFKPEVYKVDSDAAPQSVNPQQVKTAQQQQGVAPSLKPTVNAYSQYPDKFAPLPPSILGTFSSYGVQNIKGRDPVYQPTRTTYLPPQPTKQTIFNSFSFAPYFKSTPNSYFPQTTPKFQTTLNQIHFGTAISDFKATPTQSAKVPTAVKADPTAASRPNFKASPQDPFAKPQQQGIKVQPTTYYPNLQTTTSVNSYFIQNFDGSQLSQQPQTFYNQPTFTFENKKHKIHDSIPSSVNQQPSASYPDLPRKKPHLEATQNAVPPPATYEVTENYDSDDVTHSSLNSWSAITDTYDQNKQLKQTSEEHVTKDEFSDSAYSRPLTTPQAELPEEYSIVTEGEKGYDNSLNYDSHVETQSRRPLGDDFEPIGKHKLKDYYYRVSTPSHDEYTTHHKRKQRPTDATTSSTVQEHDVTTQYNGNSQGLTDALPTLPPNKHFKRPNAQEPIDKDKSRKRIKNRRRRPPLANNNRDMEETSTRRYQTTTEYSHTTEADDHTYKPRVRVHKLKQSNLTTPTVTTDLSTSVLPTISPTSPTIIKKKISQRRPSTSTTEKQESTTQALKDFDSNRESTIMKIATRPQHPRVTTATYDYKPSEAPDYSHKQDEKDTPTSDVSLGITDKTFSFHKDVKPIEAKLEPIRQDTTTEGKRDNDEEASEFATTTSRDSYAETTPGKTQRTKLKSKYESSRPKFSVKDYRNRLSSTTTTDKPAEVVAPKVRFPQRRLPYENRNNSDNEAERKKFIPKDPRHKSSNSSDNVEAQTEREVHTTRQVQRQRYTSTTESSDAPQKISSRIRNTSRRPKPEETTETSTVHIKRPMRKKVKDSEIGESVQDVSVTETTVHYTVDHKDDMTSERTRSESAIMKIAKDDKKHQSDNLDHIFEHSKRVSDLTLAASKDYNTPGMFKTVSPNSRRIPNYFTIATDDPILPIEAFFPQLNGKKES